MCNKLTSVLRPQPIVLPTVPSKAIKYSTAVLPSTTYTDGELNQFLKLSQTQIVKLRSHEESFRAMKLVTAWMTAIAGNVEAIGVVSSWQQGDNSAAGKQHDLCSG